MDYYIYHNPRCSKSRQGLQILRDNDIEPVVIQYLKDIPSKKDLAELLDKLDIKPLELIRKKEKIFVDNYKGKTFSEDEWLEILVDNPKLIERPIVIKGKKAVIGRPPEKIKTLFG